MIIIRQQFLISLFLWVSFIFSNTVLAEQVKQVNAIHLKMSASKRLGETAFSYLVTWKNKDNGLQNINGLMFVDGKEMPNPSSAERIAWKMTKAINAAVDTKSPHERGAIAVQDNAEMVVSSRAGFDLTRITVRDYSNQHLQFSVPQQSFNVAATDIAIDLVYSAAVEYIAGFSTGIKHETAGGFITVTIDNQTPIKIKTKGKSVKQLEKELAGALGSKASFSSFPIYPNFEQKRSKNYKTFDGGEVQLPALNASQIRIDIDDSGLGVLVKFHFTRIEKPFDVVSKVPYLIGLFLVGIFCYLFFIKKK